MSSRRGILEALESARESAHDFVSGADLAAKLGISRAAVWKHVAALKHSGYEIEGARARGYRLVAPPSALTESAIRSRGTGARIGRRILVLDVTRSTNSDAMALGREGEAEGMVVIAEEQTAGRGRLGRSWESSRGVNLYMSILLRPAIAPWRAPQLSLVAGIAVAETVREEGIDVGIKWPNDVVTLGSATFGSATLGRLTLGSAKAGSEAGAGAPPATSPADASVRKLAGILTEIEAEADRVAFVVVGIGVNVNATAAHWSPELDGKATSVLLERGSATDRAALAARLLARFEECYDAWSRGGSSGGFAALAPRWRALSILDGRRVTVASPGETYEGLCAGIDDDGALLVDTGQASPRRLLAGDVTISAFQGGYARCQP